MKMPKLFLVCRNKYMFSFSSALRKQQKILACFPENKWSTIYLDLQIQKVFTHLNASCFLLEHQWMFEPLLIVVSTNKQGVHKLSSSTVYYIYNSIISVFYIYFIILLNYAKHLYKNGTNHSKIIPKWITIFHLYIFLLKKQQQQPKPHVEFKILFMLYCKVAL